LKKKVSTVSKVSSRSKQEGAVLKAAVLAELKRRVRVLES